MIRLAIIGALTLASGCSAPAPADDVSVAGALKIKGAWLAPHGEDGFLTARAGEQLAHLASLGCNWVAYAPEATMADVSAPAIRYDRDGTECRQVIRKLRGAGLSVMLLPRIESPSFFRAEKPKWRGDIGMSGDAEWERFHDNLEEMCLHFARIAEEEGVELLSLGLEYRRSTSRFPSRWRRLIAAVRRVYHGPVTYSANWYREYEEIRFWRDLDYIGVGAYFPLAAEAGAPLDELLAGWMERRAELQRVWRRYRRPVLLTEVGYTALTTAGVRPYEWGSPRGRPLSERHQADCFRAFFRGVGGAPFLAGVFVWRYHTDPRFVEPWEYCPQGREAEAVIRRAFGG